MGGFELPDKNAAAHRVLTNGKLLRDIGYKVVFIGVSKESINPQNILETKTQIDDFECYSVPYPKSKKEWITYLTKEEDFNLIVNQYKDVKLVIYYNYPAIALIKIKEKCRLKKIKLIADCTEWYSVDNGNIIFKIIKGLDTFLRMKIIQKNLDG